jgi:beta-lactamase regulating signal transducer with metallopeptidase domain
MPLVFQYLLKLSISLTILYLFYFFVLRRLTFYTYNRWYLLGYSLLSFFIAAINISPLVNTNTAGTFTWIRHFPTVPQFVQTGTGANNVTETVAATVTWQPWDYITLILIGGILFLIGRLFIQIVSFRKIKRKASRVPAEGINIYQVNAPIIPFSFGKNIYINSSLHAPQELEKIIQHEFVHVKQKHTIDIICSEIICFLNWYNPFAWLIRKAIRQNLEYIADDKVLRNGINKKEYQYLLLKVIGNQKFSIATPFNFSSLKKRIAMMNKLKTSKIHVLKFMFLLPLMATVLLAFRSELSHNANTSLFTYGGIVIDNATGQPLADIKVLEQNSGTVVITDKNGFFSFKTTDQVIDHKLNIDGSTTPVQFRYSRNVPETKSFLVLVKAQQQGESLNILSSSIAMEWDGSLEEAITTGKNYATQPEIKENTEQLNNSGIKLLAEGGVIGKSGNSTDDDTFITADSITLQFDNPPAPKLR